MKPLQFVLLAAASLALSACGVPDLVAHGVKSIEKSQQPRGTEERAVAQPAQPAPSYQPARYEPESQSAPVERVPPRESVTAEPLR